MDYGGNGITVDMGLSTSACGASVRWGTMVGAGREDGPLELESGCVRISTNGGALPLASVARTGSELCRDEGNSILGA